MSHNQYSDYKQYLKCKDSNFYFNEAKQLQSNSSTDYELISKTFYKSIILNKNNVDSEYDIRNMISAGQITKQECLTSKTTARAELLQCYSVTDLK